MHGSAKNVLRASYCNGCKPETAMNASRKQCDTNGRLAPRRSAAPSRTARPPTRRPRRLLFLMALLMVSVLAAYAAHRVVPDPVPPSSIDQPPGDTFAEAPAAQA